jgi:beta-N-acetylhexosaminidase
LLKKFLFLIFILLIILLVGLFIDDKYKDKLDPPSEHSKSEINEGKTIKPDPTEQEQSNNPIKEIINHAKEGKVIDTTFVAGQTKFEELTKYWGESEDSTTISQGTYESYLTTHHVTVGQRNNLIFDLRSYHPSLQNIHLNDVKNLMGNPDEVRSFVDETMNQVILVYQLNTSYQLKWIINKPTDTTPNPEVHHISVVSLIKEPVQLDQPVSEILVQMTLKEKIGQMIIAGIKNTTATKNTLSLINYHKVGGIIFYAENIEDSKQTLKLLNQLKEVNEKNALPLFLGIDQEGGRISRLPKEIINLPSNEEIGKMDNPDFSYDIGSLLGKELNAFGFNMDFAPVMDVNSNPDNPIIGNRSYGNDPDLVSKLGIQTMKGIQSQNVISVIKHFPGHGDTAVDSHLKLPIVHKSLNELNELELIPFKQAIANGADVVMIAHILIPKLDQKFPSSMSKPIITDLLRNQLGFDGVVITDDMTMKAITDNYDIGSSSVQSVKAGSDLILVAHNYYKIVSIVEAIEKAVNAGEISEERINESVERILNLKKKYSLTNKQIESISVTDLNREIKNVLQNSQ